MNTRDNAAFPPHHDSASSAAQRVARWLLLGTAAALLFPQTSAAALIFSDPTGDTLGVGAVQHDVTSIEAVFDASDLVIDVSFAAPILPASSLDPHSLTGFIDLDIDESVGTGIVSRQTTFGTGSSGLGVEFFIDLFSEQFSPGFVEIVDTSTLLSVGLAPVIYSPTSLSVAVPLSLLSDDGAVNYGVAVGTFVEITDEATNPGEPVAASTPIPEPSTALLCWCGIVMSLGVRWRRR